LAVGAESSMDRFRQGGRIQLKTTYTVLLRAEPEGGFTVFVPALTGCISYGENIPEALRMAEEAIHCYLLALQDLGESVPLEGAELKLPASEVSGTLLAYRVGVAQEAA